MRIKRSGWCVLIAGSILLVGCTPDPQPVALDKATTAQKLQAVWAGYSDASSELRKSPESDAELFPFLKRFGPPEEVMKSPDDGQQFMVNYKASNASHIFAYERQGKDGKRTAINLRGDITSLSDAAFKKLQSAPASVTADDADSPTKKMQDGIQGKGMPAPPPD